MAHTTLKLYCGPRAYFGAAPGIVGIIAEQSFCLIVISRVNRSLIDSHVAVVINNQEFVGYVHLANVEPLKGQGKTARFGGLR